ncbi:hypothetical protein AAMO2058_001300100 [Amorphochlora amoebiformis]
MEVKKAVACPAAWPTELCTLDPIELADQKEYRLQEDRCKKKLWEGSHNPVRRSVDRAGDVNGDGYPDIFIGSRYADVPGFPEAKGRAWVIFGGPHLRNYSHINLNDVIPKNLGFEMNSLQKGSVLAEIGGRVTTAYDVNNDGIDDMMLGAPGHTALGRENCGVCGLVFGSADIGDVRRIYFDSTPPTTRELRIYGGGVQHFAGRSCVVPGDITGDGIPDIVVGAPGTQNGGSAYIIPGGSRLSSVPGGVIDLANVSAYGWKIPNGKAEINGFGRLVRDVGDIDADGLQDFIICGEKADPLLRTNAGECYVVFGSRSFSAGLTLDDLAKGPGALLILGANALDSLGKWAGLGGIGDINYDGYDDFQVNGLSGRGTAYIIYGSPRLRNVTIDLRDFESGGFGFTLEGLENGDYFGIASNNIGGISEAYIFLSNSSATTRSPTITYSPSVGPTNSPSPLPFIVISVLFAFPSIALSKIQEQNVEQLFLTQCRDALVAVQGNDQKSIVITLFAGSVIANATVETRNPDGLTQSDPASIFSQANGFNTALFGEAISYSPSTAVTGGGDDWNFLLLMIVVAILAAVTVILLPIGICYYHKKKRSLKSSNNQTENEIFISEASKLPVKIDIFRSTSQDIAQWHGKFSSFIMRIETVDGIRECLIENGRAWKIHLFRFITGMLSKVPDFETIDENTGRLISMKEKLVSLSVAILAKIDIQDFTLNTKVGKWIKEKQAPEDSIKQSLALIKKSCKFESKTEERAIQNLYLYAIVTALTNRYYGMHFGRAPNISSPLWIKVVELTRMVLEISLVKKIDKKGFTLEGHHRVFTAGRLIEATDKLINNQVLKKMLVPEMRDASMIHERRKGRKAIKMNIQKIVEAGEVFSELCLWMAHVAKICKQKNKSSSSEGMVSIFKTKGSRITNLTDNIATLLAKKKLCKSKRLAAECLIFSAMKMYKTTELKAVKSLAMHLHKNSAGMANIGASGLRFLYKSQMRMLAGQINARNCINEAKGLYDAKLSGVRATVQVMKTRLLPASETTGLFLHQKLSASPFIVHMFGIGFSPRHGWFTAIEYVEKSLWDVIQATPPLDIQRRIKLAVDTARGFEFLHEEGIFHRNINPTAIQVTNTCKAKIQNFNLSAEITGRYTLKTLRTRAIDVGSLNCRMPVYVSPEQHALPEIDMKSSAEQSAKSDVYSLGAVLAELLSSTRAKLDNILPELNLEEHFQKLAREHKLDFRIDDLERDVRVSSFKNALIRKASSRSTSISSNGSFTPFRGSIGSYDHNNNETNASIQDMDSKAAPSSFDLNPFGLDDMQDAISQATYLNPRSRPKIKDLRKMLMQLQQNIAMKSAFSSKVRILSESQVQCIEEKVSVNSLIRGTTNVHKISMFGIDVAVKVYSSTRKQDAFTCEAEMLQNASRHQSVVKLFGIGSLKYHGFFLCMEFLPTNLHELCFQNPPLPLRLRLQMAIEMGSAFSFLHKTGIIHRDIKPKNVLVTQDFKTRICDFGISQRIGMPALEEKGKILGTPYYMAPEQHIENSIESISTQVDIYAFGILLAELFTGVSISDVLPGVNMKQYYKSWSRKPNFDPGKIAFESRLFDAKMHLKILPIVHVACAFDPDLRESLSLLRTKIKAVYDAMQPRMDWDDPSTPRQRKFIDYKGTMDSISAIVTSPSDTKQWARTEDSSQNRNSRMKQSILSIGTGKETMAVTDIKPVVGLKGSQTTIGSDITQRSGAGIAGERNLNLCERV